MQTITIETKKQKEIIDLTELINQKINQENASDGICVLFIKHTTAALTTADLDPGTDLDMLDAFDEIVPKLKYRHPHDPTHVKDHIMASIIGPSVMIPIQNGELDLGPGNALYL